MQLLRRLVKPATVNRFFALFTFSTIFAVVVRYCFFGWLAPAVRPSPCSTLVPLPYPRPPPLPSPFASDALTGKKISETLQNAVL